MVLVLASFCPIRNMSSFCSMDEILNVWLPPWFAISNSTMKGNSLRKIITFIKILSNFTPLKMDVVMCVSHAQHDCL